MFHKLSPNVVKPKKLFPDDYRRIIGNVRPCSCVWKMTVVAKRVYSVYICIDYLSKYFLIANSPCNAIVGKGAPTLHSNAIAK